MVQKNKEIHILDSSSSVLQKINVNLKKDISAADKKEVDYKAEIQKMDTTFIKLQVEKTKAENKADKQTKRKRTWCGIALGEAGLLALIITGLLLL